MMATKNAPRCGNSYGAFKQDNRENHPVPIVTHPKPLFKRNRIKLVWTPLNIALLILLAAVAIYFTVQAVIVDPLAFELTSMADSVFNV